MKATVKAEPIENINDIFARMREGRIEGRIVVDYHMSPGQQTVPPPAVATRTGAFERQPVGV